MKSEGKVARVHVLTLASHTLLSRYVWRNVVKHLLENIFESRLEFDVLLKELNGLANAEPLHHADGRCNQHNPEPEHGFRLALKFFCKRESRASNWTLPLKKECEILTR